VAGDRLWIGQSEAVVIDEERRLLTPHLPGALRDRVVDALAEFATHWSALDSGQFLTKFGAIYRTRHWFLLVI